MLTTDHHDDKRRRRTTVLLTAIGAILSGATRALISWLLNH